MTNMGGGDHTATMPEWQRKILRDHRDILASDLDVNDVMNVMIQENILTRPMAENLKAKPTMMERTEAFLDLLPRRGEKAFRIFLSALEETYEHLYITLKTAADHEQQRPTRIDSEIYEDVVTLSGFTQPTETGPLTYFDHPQSYITPVVHHQGDPGMHSRELHPTVEIIADVMGELVDTSDKQGIIYPNTDFSYTGLVSSCVEQPSMGATAASVVDVRRRRVGNFIATGEKILVKKGSLAIVHKYLPQEGLAVVMYRVKLAFVPLYYVQQFGDPEGEKWYSQTPLAATQAEQILKVENQEGCFVVYKPTYDKDITPYELSLRLSNGTVKHYPIYRFEKDQLGFKNEQINFKNLKDLVEYHRQNRGILECRLKRGLGELDEPVSFGKEWEIDHSDVDFEEGKELGSGCFGTLHQALYKNKIVAVKKPRSDTRSREAITEEAKVLMSLKHKNIPRLLGVISREEPSLVLECLHDGDLSWWLKNSTTRDWSTRLHICQQVAGAVSYLHEQRWVLHRDIAAYNCQVTDASGNNQVFIRLANFSMARRVADDAYYAEKEEKNATRWSAPEVLHEGKYSSKSDIWSLGVLVWEVYSNGEKPFASLNKEQVVQMVVECKFSVITDNHTLSRDAREVCEIIEKCCEYAPDDRPTASSVCEWLANCRETVAGLEHHLQPVDHSLVLRRALSYRDLTSQDDSINVARNNPERSRFFNLMRRKGSKGSKNKT